MFEEHPKGNIYIYEMDVPFASVHLGYTLHSRNPDRWVCSKWQVKLSTDTDCAAVKFIYDIATSDGGTLEKEGQHSVRNA